MEFVTMGYMESPNLSQLSKEDTRKQALIDCNNYNRNRCEMLKNMRRKLVEENELDFEIAECSLEGLCMDICDACEAERDELDRLLRAKKGSENT